jgi:hypothetical protein
MFYFRTEAVCEEAMPSQANEGYPIDDPFDLGQTVDDSHDPFISGLSNAPR